MTTKESDYSAYIKSFTRLFEAYDAALPYLEAGEDFKLFAERKRHWLERLKSPEFPVAFLGAFSAGKSTIINAVLGEDILPQATKSFTAIPTLISRGTSRRGVIHYLGELEREELKGLYVEEISKELRRPAGDYLKLERTELLRRLDKDIEQHTGQLGSFGKQKFFDELKALIQGWKKLNGAVKEITLAELPKYVTEEYEDVLFVDKARIFLTDVNIPDNVVLVDLPGLGVVNPRHRKVTKSYVENDAKAFVIAMKVFHLLEGEEIELLAEIHGQRKRVLQRAFWSINQWDVLTAKQKREEAANFEHKIESYGFHIAKDRVFRVSALNYLLLKLVAEGRLEKAGKISEHIDTLQKSLGKIPERAEAEAAIKSLDEVKAFSQFRNHLFEYLANTAKDEFLSEARSEYAEMAAQLREKLDPLYQIYRNKNDDSMKNAYIAAELSRRQDEVLSRLRAVIKEHAKLLRTDILPELVFWRDEDQARLAAKIQEAFDTLDRKALRNELLKGLDVHGVVSRLPHKIEENLHIQRIFRDQLQALLDEQIVSRFLLELLDTIGKSDALPEEMLSALRDRLSGRDLVNRLKGMSDVFLYNYGDVIDELGRAIMNNSSSSLQEGTGMHAGVMNRMGYLDSSPADAWMPSVEGGGMAPVAESGFQHTESPSHPVNGGASRRDHIDQALEFYKTGLLDYTRRQQDQINTYARRGIKNYFEELEDELLGYFETNKGLIAKVIMKQLTAQLDAELNGELEKQRVIKEAYQVVTTRPS